MNQNTHNKIQQILVDLLQWQKQFAEIEERYASINQEYERNLLVWKGDFDDLQKSFSRLRNEFNELYDCIDGELNSV